MRVIAGNKRGLQLKAVTGTITRPTAERVKEAIFSRIGPFFAGGLVLDLFAGTGSLGIESLSRGADRAIFIDKHKACGQIIRRNLTHTNLLEQAEVYVSDAGRALRSLSKRGLKFSLVFLDPPYYFAGLSAILQQLDEHMLLAEEAVIVVEHPQAQQFPRDIGHLQREQRSVYGDTAITYYRYRGGKENDTTA